MGAACAIVIPITIIVIAMRNKFAASFRCHFIAASLSKASWHNIYAGLSERHLNAAVLTG
jgi:hypothetical protein